MNLPAAPGSVRTVDGRTAVGDIQLTNGWLLVISTNAEPVRFTSAELRAVQFNEPASDTNAAGGKGNGLLGFYFNNTT